MLNKDNLQHAQSFIFVTKKGKGLGRFGATRKGPEKMRWGTGKNSKKSGNVQESTESRTFLMGMFRRSARDIFFWGVFISFRLLNSNAGRTLGQDLLGHDLENAVLKGRGDGAVNLVAEAEFANEGTKGALGDDHAPLRRSGPLSDVGLRRFLGHLGRRFPVLLLLLLLLLGLGGFPLGSTAGGGPVSILVFDAGLELMLATPLLLRRGAGVRSLVGVEMLGAAGDAKRIVADFDVDVIFGQAGDLAGDFVVVLEVSDVELGPETTLVGDVESPEATLNCIDDINEGVSLNIPVRRMAAGMLLAGGLLEREVESHRRCASGFE